MVEYYNLTPMLNSNNTGFLNLAQGTSALVSNLPGLIIMLIVFSVIFLVLKQKGQSAGSCFAASSWVVAFVGIFLKIDGLISGYVFWIVLILAPVSAFLLFMSE